jgi:hypothetical protein
MWSALRMPRSCWLKERRQTKVRRRRLTDLLLISRDGNEWLGRPHTGLVARRRPPLI